MASHIPPLPPDTLHSPGTFTDICRDMRHSHYWTRDWSARTYAGLASMGFISTSCPAEDDWVLLPEMQKAYAVLDWPDLHMGRTTRQVLHRIARREALGEEFVRLRLDFHSPSRVLDGLAGAWNDQSWLGPPYRQLMEELAAGGPWPGNFRLVAVELLRETREGTKLAGGELGYMIGATYTSLTGFVDRSEPAHRGLGTLQLHGLAAMLQQEGFAFWNLGHPYMQYKLDLGARILPRRDFLERWLTAALDPSPPPGAPATRESGGTPEGGDARPRAFLHGEEHLLTDLLLHRRSPVRN